MYSPDNFEAQAREFFGHRTETAVTRHGRVSAAVDAAVAEVCGTRAARTTDTARIKTRLDTQLPRCERPLAYALIPAAITAYVPLIAPPVVQGPRGKCRRGRDDEDDPNKKQKTGEVT
jgi:hypothetical protein